MTDAMPHLLVVEDDAGIRRHLKRFLGDNGFLTTVAADAAEARAHLASLCFDLIVLDVMMPGEDGLSLIRSLRPEMDTPVLLLTARGEVDDRIAGLEAGADDYPSKPFEPRELVLRIQSILRRAPPPSDDARPIRLGDCLFDVRRVELWRGDDRIHLTGVEASLLQVLAAHPGTVLSREDLTELTQISGNARTVDVQVTRLRRKIEPDPRLPRYLQTVRGEGYVLRPDG